MSRSGYSKDFCVMEPFEDDNASVKELKDYESRLMILIGKFFFNSMIFKDPDNHHVSVATLSRFTPKAVFFHPNNNDAACLLVFLTFTSWNIPSGEVGIIGQSPHEHIGYHKSLANCPPLVTYTSFRRIHKMPISSDATALVLCHSRSLMISIQSPAPLFLGWPFTVWNSGNITLEYRSPRWSWCEAY